MYVRTYVSVCDCVYVCMYVTMYGLYMYVCMYLGYNRYMCNKHVLCMYIIL